MAPISTNRLSILILFPVLAILWFTWSSPWTSEPELAVLSPEPSWNNREGAHPVTISSLLPLAERDVVVGPTNPVPDTEDSLILEESMTPSWKPEPDSPVAFFSTPEDLEFYAPTEKSMVSWMRTVPRYKELTDEQFHEAWETPGFPEAWKLDREHLALRTFIGAYQDREYDRWFAGQSSVALESEIQPVVSFIASLPSPGAAEKLITEYSSSVIQAIYKNGEKQPQKDPVSARWPLFGELTNQASLDTELVGQTLDGFLPS